MKAAGRATNTSEERKTKKWKKKHQSDRSIRHDDKSEVIFKKTIIQNKNDTNSIKTIKNKISKTHKHTDSNNTHMSSLNNSSLLRTTTK